MLRPCRCLTPPHSQPRALRRSHTLFNSPSSPVQTRSLTTTMSGSATEPQVQVRFTTKLEARFRVTEAPIQLPTRLTRHGLSEVINHLLNAEKPAAFDFVTEDGSLLRGSLAKYLTVKSLSGESVIALEYIELMAPPEEQSGADAAKCDARRCLWSTRASLASLTGWPLPAHHEDSRRTERR